MATHPSPRTVTLSPVRPRGRLGNGFSPMSPGGENAERVSPAPTPAAVVLMKSRVAGPEFVAHIPFMPFFDDPIKVFLRSIRNRQGLKGGSVLRSRNEAHRSHFSGNIDERHPHR